MGAICRMMTQWGRSTCLERHSGSRSNFSQLNGLDLHLELHRNTDTFCLLCFQATPVLHRFQIAVEDIRWLVKKIQLPQSITLAVEAALLRTTAKYPIKRVQIKVIHLPGQRWDTLVNAVFSGQIPWHLIIALVDAEAFHGAYGKSPFWFQNYDATSIQICAGGQNYPANAITMSYPLNRFTQPYVHFFETLNFTGLDTSPWISLEEYKNGHTIYAFDLSLDNSNGGHWELLKDGTISVHMKFGADLPDPGVKMICYAEYDSFLSIDRWRNVYFDFTP